MHIFSVSAFIEFLNAAFSAAVFPEGVVVEGEVSEYRVSGGKWIWFLLKDEQATVSCFSTVWQLRHPAEDGMRVRVSGLPKIHPKSGRFSITVEKLEPVGDGALRRSFELLKKKLAAEGIFAPERKRLLPPFPRRVGLIASRESAAYGDFLRVLGDRWGGVRVSLISVQVQGRDSVRQIVDAFRYFDSHPGLAELIVLTRGGGSLEDLQAFNSEEVTRAVFASKVPVVVGVGHERDETLADFAADVRAATPTNAAEIIVPDRREVEAAVASWAARLTATAAASVRRRTQEVEGLSRQAAVHMRTMLTILDSRISRLAGRAEVFAASVGAIAGRVAVTRDRLEDSVGVWLDRLIAGLSAQERVFRGLDPKAVLARGYSIVRSAGHVVTDAGQLDIGDRLEVQLSHGRLAADVAEISQDRSL